MFDDQKPTSTPPEDIFSGMDAAEAPPAPVSAPAARPPVPEPVAPPRPTNPPLFEGKGGAMPAGLDPDEQFSRAPASSRPAPTVVPRGRGRSVTKIVAIVVVIAVLILAAFLLAGLVLRSRKAVVPEQPTAERPASTLDVTTPLEEVIDTKEEDFTFVEEEPEPEPEAPVLAPDSDRDGLTDDEEAALGTSVRSADTDNDGLSDRDEIKVWSTNPLNPDSDGDSFLDGQEVRSGYDPKGSGKLLEVPRS